MTLAAVSIRSVNNQTILLATHLDLSSPSQSGKLLLTASILHPKKPTLRNRIIQLNQRQKGYLAFAVPNESDEYERGTSQACADVEKNKNCKNLEMENVVLVPHSEADLSRSDEHLGNQGNPLDKLKAVHLHVLALEQWNASRLKLCHRDYLVSATNLIHYLALKCLDIRQLEEDLSSIGLLNLETINPHVLPSLTAGIQMLEHVKSNHLNKKEKQDNKEFTITTMRKKAFLNRDLLLGPVGDEVATHIMVTIGQEAIENETLIPDLLKKGTTIFRINCAHGNPNLWGEIIGKVRSNSQVMEKPCKILMDLAGPKIRTGDFKTGPRVIKISPKKDASGKVIFPAKIWLASKGSKPPPHLSLDAVLYIDSQDFINKLELDSSVRFNDARGKQRNLRISKSTPVFGGLGFMAECNETAYIELGTVLYIKGKKRKLLIGRVVDVPPIEQFVRLRVGDLLTISRDNSNEDDEFGEPNSHRVVCSSGYLFESVKPGEPIAFDDGKIWGVIQGVSISEIVVSITHAGLRGTKLGSEKSINIPESSIRFEGLTTKDLMDLEFIASHADMVGISFVRDVKDIIVLRQELEKRKLRNLGVVLKIETKSGFEKLPLMLMEAMKSRNPLGVMIARGDLAVECGWERLADIQEEILSICGAAHVPVIWATQVLESLVKSGVPTRAEITDAASGRRASCIMLNKGKYILEGVSTLETILCSNSTKVKAELKPLVLSSHLC